VLPPKKNSQDDVECLGAGAVHEAEVSAEDVVDAGDVLELAELEEEEDGGEHAVGCCCVVGGRGSG
jgi:hypothetical protein